MKAAASPELECTSIAPKHNIRRDLVISLSLANLCFLNAWVELTNTGLYYFRQVPPRAAMIAAALANVLLLTMFIWAAITIVRRTRSPWLKRAGRIGFLLFLLVPLNMMRTSVAELAGNRFVTALGPWYRVIVIALAISIIVLALVRTNLPLRLAVAGLTILSPLPLLMLGQAIWTHLQRPPDAAFASTSFVAPTAKPRGTRILWMLFDEWDYRLASSKHDPPLALPELHRLTTQAFNATHVVGGGYGIPHALPSLLTGRRVMAERDAGPADLMVRFEGSQEFQKWSAQPSVFSRLRDHGWTSAVVGWFLPYCRVLGAEIDICRWEAGASIYDRPEYSRDLSIGESMRTLAHRQVSRIPVLRRHWFRKDVRQRALQMYEYQRIRDDARALLGTTDFMFVHWPVPHPFGIYDRATGRIGIYPASTYLDNLVLADRTIGEFRRLLEQQGRWDDTTVIISSDHSLRIAEWRYSGVWSPEEAQATGNKTSPYVPLIVKLAGQDQARNYDPPVSMLLVHDLILALARGDVRTPQDLTTWFDRHRP